MARTQVAILGAGPAGLLLAHLLHRAGIESIVVERHSRAHVEGRIRAGVLEHATAALLAESGLGARLRREGMEHAGLELAWEGRRHRIDLKALTGRSIWVYGQHEVVKDLIAARLDAGGELRFETPAVALEGLEGERPGVLLAGGGGRIACDFVAGCDGFHGIARAAVPAGRLTVLERRYPFAWLGILAEAPPRRHELVYASHDEGFALFSMRSPEITRAYLQCAPDEPLAAWPDARIWETLHRRLEDGGGWRLNEGPILQKGVTAMRSYVAEPLSHGRLFLAGDAAHIVPPTGAKGMNLAVADVRRLAEALDAFYRQGRRDLLEGYSAGCLARVWQAQRFSWWMTQLLHRFPGADPFSRRLQRAELDRLAESESAARNLAESYVGPPL